MTEQSKKYLSDVIRAIERQLSILGEAVFTSPKEEVLLKIK